jgi:hypothetical protein
MAPKGQYRTIDDYRDAETVVLSSKAWSSSLAAIKQLKANERVL